MQQGLYSIHSHNYRLLPPAKVDTALEVEDQLRELREATERMKAAKLFMKNWKKEQKKSSGKREEKKRLEEQLKRVKLEVKLEDEAAKQQSTLETTKRKRSNDDDMSDSDSDGFGMAGNKKKTHAHYSGQMAKGTSEGGIVRRVSQYVHRPKH
jgi:hypothetical protein